MGDTIMSARKNLLVGAALLVLAFSANAQELSERWEAAEVGTYVPPDLINGDAGAWFLGDTVSEFPDCGPTPQRGEILVLNGNKALRLQSNDSASQCIDDVWLALTEFDSTNPGFSVPLVAGSIISFREIGQLIDPQLHDSGQNCTVPPCFDNVSLLLEDSNANLLAYVFQRYPDAVANVPNVNFGDTYREVFLDPAAVSYRRDLFSDFQTIPSFDPQNAEIVYIEFRVDEHGWAILDDLAIDSQGQGGLRPIYRFWSPVVSCHFFTADEMEKLSLIANYPGIWVFEGVAYHALTEGMDPDALPVYRFWSPVLSSHFYTINPVERDRLINSFPDVWTFEGTAFYAFAIGFQPVDARPVYRFWSPVLECHFYTISESERELLVNNYPGVWDFEGIAWYAYP